MTLHAWKGYTYHSLQGADYEELAASMRLRPGVNSGVSFTRKALGRDTSSYKDRARGKAVSFHGPHFFDRRLRILTMPGLRWSFERAVEKLRSEWQWIGRYPDALTDFYGVEGDPAIFRASLRWMPGFSDGVTVTRAQTIQTRLAVYTLDTVENVLCHPPDVNAAWLDFSGPLTSVRFEALRTFWRTVQPRAVTVTSEAARWEPVISRAITKHGGIAAWLCAELAPAACLYSLRYAQPVPMEQVMIREGEPKRWPWRIDVVTGVRTAVRLGDEA